MILASFNGEWVRLAMRLGSFLIVTSLALTACSGRGVRGSSSEVSEHDVAGNQAGQAGDHTGDGNNQSPTGDSNTGGPTGASDSATGASGATGSTGQEWVPLLSRHWSLGPISESFKCVSIQTTEDIWISAIRPSPGDLPATGKPHGVVRMLLSTADPAEWPPGSGWPDTGEYDCIGSGWGSQILFVGGVGTGDVVMPEGVAMYIPAGKLVILQMFVVNFDAVESLQADSGILIKKGQAVSPEHRADVIMMGSTRPTFPIPNSGQPVEKYHSCSFPVPYKLFGLWANMHLLGTWTKMVHRPDSTDGSQDQAILDADYDFFDQAIHPRDFQVMPNDQFFSTCVYVNTTSWPASFSDSMAGEQCMFGIYKYPAGLPPHLCVEN